jgi:hypothetical protein
MSYKKIFKLAEKFEQKLSLARTDARLPFDRERETLDYFSLELSKRLVGLISEMGGDIRVLKERKLPKEIISLSVEVYKNLLSIYHSISDANPFLAGEALVNYANDRKNKTILDNLQFLIPQYLKKTELNVSLFQPVRVESFEKISKIAYWAQVFMVMAHEPPSSKKTFAPPPKNPVNDVETKVEVIKKDKVEAAQ